MSNYLGALAPGTLPQWGMLVTLLGIAAGLWTAWIRGAPERRRAANEARIIDNTEAGRLRDEFMALHKLDRKDIHDLRNSLAILTGDQHKCTKALGEAHAENLKNRDDMRTLLFLIRLLISEVKRLDPDPENIIIKQAEMTLLELERKRKAGDEVVVGAAETADRAVTAAEKTVDAARETVAEIKAEVGK